MENADDLARRAKPYREVVSERIVQKVGEAEIIRRLAAHLPADEPMDDFDNDDVEAILEAADRARAFTLRDIVVENEPISWVYTFTSQHDDVAPKTVRIRPWQSLDRLHFSTNRRADLYRASYAAGILWDESVADLVAGLSAGDWRVFARIGSASAPFSELMQDQVERLMLDDPTGDGDLNGDPVFSIRLIPCADRQIGRPARERERAIAFLRERWSDQKYPATKEIIRAAEKEGLTLSDATIRRAKADLRQNPSDRT